MLKLARVCTVYGRRSLLAASHGSLELESQAWPTPTLLGALALGIRGIKKSAQQVRAGDLVQREGRPYRVSRFHWMHGQARAAGFVTLDLVDLATGARTSEKFRLEDQVELADVESKDMQVLYQDDDGNVHVMDGTTYEQAVLSPDLFGEGRKWLGTPELTVSVSYFEGEPVAAKLPYKIPVEVLDAPTAVVKEDGTSSRHVVVEGGISVVAPSFVRKGDVIVVRTEDGTYMTKG
ncbi:hypothetical protein VOLCADRAFT_127327 [Volvox carteri f. nagariensis]|uniref:Uncharacterized protein efp2 n=1 Tax=Volvox carteri f. nagariensis TaxID=3068 RepID=D8THX4_VOLCA|nr:uncharacterized protein VOLCADRAFT_127327 [Volvox carteri f. nagariensis]EFJ52790.1 hypothetical protein VOLCADRAFT_127327 [Volvox carteri f. nagariensis]|eukprot:XP_002945795.1 hypothetical protein VOLCADRAFT_127327 [Volvox carteri f. nagariensis]